MANLVGNETAGAASFGMLKKKAYLSKRECTETGKVEVLHQKITTGTGTTFRLALYSDNAGKPGTLLAETGVITVATATELVVEGSITATEVTKGTIYWIGMLALTGTAKSKMTEKAGWGFISTAEVETFAAAVMTTAQNGYGEPAPLWGSGTAGAGGGVSGKATGAILLTGKATGTAVQVVSGKATGPLLLTGTATGTAAQRVTGTATGPLLLTGTAKGTAAQVVSGKAAGTLILTGSATAVGGAPVTAKASGTLLLLGAASGTAAQVVSGKATGTLLLTGTSTGTTAQRVSGQATGRLLLTGHAKGTATTPGGERRIVIMIYEE